MATIVENLAGYALDEKRYEGWFAYGLTREFTIHGSNDATNVGVLALGPQYGDQHPSGLELYVVNRQFRILAAAETALTLIVRYGSLDELGRGEGEDEDDELSTMAQTIHVERSPVPGVSQQHFPPYGSGAGVGEFIGVQDGNVAGVDIYVPAGTYRARRRVQELTEGGYSLLTYSAGCVNSDAWKWWQAGEVLFIGATASQRGLAKWMLEFQFAISMNVDYETNPIQTQNGVASFKKAGWDYFWVEKSQTYDATNKRSTFEVSRVHVSQVYPRVAFTSLFQAFGL